MKKIALLFLFSIVLISCKNDKKVEESDTAIIVDTSIEDESLQDEKFNITPISHATMVLQWDSKIIYVDPVGGAEAFGGQPQPDLILITDIHGDHYNEETLVAVVNESTSIITPQAVADKIPNDLKAQTTVINNGESKNKLDFTIEAIPMYNLPETADSRHPKGRGNGYVIEKEGMRIYISGDTEDIPEMRNLKNIDIAFVCMNLPYTMTVESAADAVLAFKPNTIYPFHYRGTDGLSDVEKFKSLVEAGNEDIKVTLLDWYPKK
jgi:L-ascorbate metabolism protein UlaG (beta-lactamase superfamily)